jgi:phage baseplate assembly protein V
MIKALEHFRNRLRNMICRGIVKLVDDGTTLQTLQLSLLAGELRDGIERFQDYGLTSHPFNDAEAVVLFPGGDRSHGLCIKVDDRRYRLTALAQGEVALYDDQGQTVHIRRDGIYVISAQQLVVDTPQALFTGDVGIDGQLYVAGDIDSDADVIASGISLINHTHPITSGSSAGNTGPAQ